MSGLERNSPLAFVLELTDGRSIQTVGDAADFLATLSLQQRERAHWRTAILMFGNAMKEERYLTTASISLRSGLIYDRLMDDR